MAIHRTSSSEQVLSFAVVQGHGAIQFPFHDESGSVSGRTFMKGEATLCFQCRMLLWFLRFHISTPSSLYVRVIHNHVCHPCSSLFVVCTFDLLLFVFRGRTARKGSGPVSDRTLQRDCFSHVRQFSCSKDRLI